ncbi:MAG: phage holin family protein [Steroidobacteraceae bacterium]
MLPGEDLREERPGLLVSLRAMFSTGLQLLQTRLELFTTELEEEMHRIAGLLLWSIIAIFFGGLFILMLAVTVVIAFWDEHRLAAAIGMTSIFAIVVLVSGLIVRAKIAAHTRLLSLTLEELRRDHSSLAGVRHAGHGEDE